MIPMPNYPIIKEEIENKEEKTKLLINYYANADLKPLKFTKFRQYKFQMFDGSWRTIKRIISTKQQLRDILIKYKPLNAYQSSGAFLNPKIVKQKPDKDKSAGFKIAENIFMWNDMVFDQDEKDRETAYINSLKIVNYLNDNYNMLPDIVVQTSRGFHVHYFGQTIAEKLIKKDYFKIPYDREKYYQKVFNEISKELKHINFDKTCLQTRRLFRIPNSIHKSGVICRVVDIFNKEDCMKVERLWTD